MIRLTMTVEDDGVSRFETRPFPAPDAALAWLREQTRTIRTAALWDGTVKIAEATR